MCRCRTAVVGEARIVWQCSHASLFLYLGEHEDEANQIREGVVSLAISNRMTFSLTLKVDHIQAKASAYGFREALAHLLLECVVSPTVEGVNDAV